MKTGRIAPIILLVVLAAATPGCLLVAGAAIGAGAVHALGEDSSEVTLDRSRSVVMDAARSEIEARGVLDAVDEGPGRYEGTVEKTAVTVIVGGEVDGLVKVTVSARKNSGFTPDPVLADSIAHAIARRCR